MVETEANNKILLLLARQCALASSPLRLASLSQVQCLQSLILLTWSKKNDYFPAGFNPLFHFTPPEQGPSGWGEFDCVCLPFSAEERTPEQCWKPEAAELISSW